METIFKLCIELKLILNLHNKKNIAHWRNLELPNIMFEKHYRNLYVSQICSHESII